ncbi:MAG TPA: hypothetical protein VD913_02015 [bacterium]|nr:hypothetical protein [bacterium]
MPENSTFSTKSRPNIPSFLLALFGVALAGSIILLIATAPWGIGISKDGGRYLAGARGFLAGHGFVNAVKGDPITHWPPFFSFSLAVIGFFGIDPVDGARGLHVVLYGINIFIVGFLIKRFSQSTIAALAGALLMLSSVTIVESHSLVRSEPWFIFLVFTGFFCLLEYLGKGSKRFFFASCGLIALGCLDRYVGITAIAAGMIMILVFDHKLLRLRLINSMVYGILSFIPLGLWLVRNRLMGDNFTNRNLAFHFPAPSYFRQGLDTFSTWIFPFNVPLNVKSIALITFLATLTAMLALVVQKEKKIISTASAGSGDFFRVIALMTLFSLCLIGLEIFHHTFLYAHVQANGRHFLPVFVAGIIGSLVLLNQFFRHYPRLYIFKIAVAVFFISVGFSYVRESGRYLIHTYKEGNRYSSRAWKTSPTIAKARNLPEDALIYSNNPGPLYILLKRKARTLPRKYHIRHFREKESAQLNSNFSRKVEKARERLISRNGYIVYFRSNRRWHKIPENELGQHFPLVLMERLKDGSVYKVDPLANLETPTENFLK